MRNQLLGNRYRIQERIGEGGMAYVYVALDEKLGRKVAIKVLHEHMEKNPDIRKRFQAEAQAISSLDHPNIVKIYDFSGDHSDRLWIVTEVIRGKNLAQYVQQFTGGWLHPLLASCIVREILKALEKAHGQGIVHRDIKPENVMLTLDGRIKLMDFGIAKDLGKTTMTMTGTFMGSPSYMSPEQIRGRDIDLRSDLYSLSVLFYEIVTGRLPFVGQTTHEVVMRIMEGEFVYPKYIVPSLHDPLNDMIVKGMMSAPHARFQSAREHGAAIEHFLGSVGFDESHIELERYFKDRAAFEQRLGKRSHVAGPGAPSPIARATGQQMPQAVAPPGTRAPQSPRATSNQPQRPLAATEKLTTPPFGGDDTWQRHLDTPVSATPRVNDGPRPTRTRPPTTAVAPSTAQPTQRLDPATPPQMPSIPLAQAGARQLRQTGDGPTAAPMSPRATHALMPAPLGAPTPYAAPGGAAPRQPVRGRRRTYARAPQRSRAVAQNDSFLAYVFGVVLVGVIGVVSLWGFFALSQRIAVSGKKEPTHTASELPPTKRPAKHRDGFQVRTVAHTPAVPSPAPGATPEPQATPAAIAMQPEPSPAPRRDTTPVKPRATRRPAKPGPRPEPPRETLADAETSHPVETTPAEAPSPKPTTAAHDDAHPAMPTKEPTVAVAKETAAPRAGGKAKVLVSSQPAAEVFVDGKRLGTTIDATVSSGWLVVSAGKHTLELRRQGYAPHRSRLELDDGEQRTLPRIDLAPAGAADAAHAEHALTLRVNAFPAQVTIRNLDTNSTTAFTQKTASRIVTLESGRYLVRVEASGESKERELDLSGPSGQLTFNAEFKAEE